MEKAKVTFIVEFEGGDKRKFAVDKSMTFLEFRKANNIDEGVNPYVGKHFFKDGIMLDDNIVISEEIAEDSSLIYFSKQSNFNKTTCIINVEGEKKDISSLVKATTKLSDIKNIKFLQLDPKLKFFKNDCELYEETLVKEAIDSNNEIYCGFVSNKERMNFVNNLTNPMVEGVEKLTMKTGENDRYLNIKSENKLNQNTGDLVKKLNLLNFDQGQVKTILRNTAYLSGCQFINGEVKPSIKKMFSHKECDDITDFILPNLGNNFLYEASEDIKGSEMMKKIEGYIYTDLKMQSIFRDLGTKVETEWGSKENKYNDHQYYMESYQIYAGQIAFDNVRVPNEDFLNFFEGKDINADNIKTFLDYYGTHAISLATIGAAHYKFMESENFKIIKDDYTKTAGKVAANGLLAIGGLMGVDIGSEDFVKYQELSRNFTITCRGGLDDSDRLHWLSTLSPENLKIVKVDTIRPTVEYLSEPTKIAVLNYINNLSIQNNKIMDIFVLH